jgi:hypothetical protein
MICPFCNTAAGDTDNFCSSCGRVLNKIIPRSDFELGRIAALDTIKKDILSWFGGGLILLTILGAFGISELIKNQVGTSVDKRLEDLKKRIEDAESQSREASARAHLESEKLETDMKDLSRKQIQLESDVEDLGQKKARLAESIQQVDSQRARMVDATNDVIQKEAQLKRTIESENLTTVFAKLQHDFHRIRTLTARVHVILSKPIDAEEEPILMPGILSFLRKSQGAKDKHDVVIQFYRTDDLTHEADLTGQTTELIVRYEMFAPFETRLLNQPIASVDNLDSLVVTFGVMGGIKNGDEFLSGFRTKLGSVKEISIRLELNSVPLPKITISNEELRAGKRDEDEAKRNDFRFDSPKEIGNLFTDIQVIYDAQLTSAK